MTTDTLKLKKILSAKIEGYPIFQNIFSYNKYMYKVPGDIITGRVYSLRAISLNNSYSKFTTHNNQPCRLFVNKSESDNLFVELASFKAQTDESPDSIPVHLYKIGVTSPVASKSIRMSGNAVPQLLLNDVLEMGDYFLYFPGAVEENTLGKEAASYYEIVKGGICLFFSVWCSGCSILHPEIRKVSINRPGMDLQRPVFSSRKLKVSFYFDSIPEKENEFSLFCYTAERTYMADGIKVLKQVSCKPKNITFYLSSNRIWIPGEYIFILAHNRYPFAKCSMVLSPEGEITTRIELPELSSPEFWMVSELEFGINERWRNLLRFGGIHTIVEQIQMLESKFLFWKNEPRMHNSPIFTVMSESCFTSLRIPMVMRDFFNGSKYEAINCHDKDRSWNVRWERFAEREYRKGKLFILYHIDSLADPENWKRYESLCKCLHEDNCNCVLTLCGSEREFEILYNACPEIESHMNDAIPLRVNNYTLHDVLDIITDDLDRMYISVSPDTENYLYQVIRSLWEEHQLELWTLKEIQQWLDDTIVPLLEERGGYTKPRVDEYRDRYIQIHSKDIELETYLSTHPLKRRNLFCSPKGKEEFDRAMKELNEMVGLTHLKEELAALFYKQNLNYQRKLLGLPGEDTSTHHVIFTGNPGTGKTTVARLMGRIFKAMGILSKGNVICTERNQLVKQYIGHTEEHVEKVLEEAKGNVLFIDEAYSLCDTTKDRVDYGNHVIEALLTKLTDPQIDMVVILAGYAENFERLLEQNKGLRSRFVHIFHFEDYTAPELMQIALSDMKRKRYRLTPEAESCMRSLIEKEVMHKDPFFSNGRWVKQLVNDFILPAMAKRVMETNQTLNVKLLTEITLADVEQAQKALCKQKGKRRRTKVGFL